jgi:hypothetical protein
MAPEAFEPSFGTEVDVWSMGCLIVEMCTGKPPWAELNMQQIITAVVVRKRVPDVPDSAPAAETVRKCFAFGPKERPTASELADALAPQVADAVDSTALLQLEALTAEFAAYKQAAEAALEAASSRLVESESLVAELTGRISALQAENEAPSDVLRNEHPDSRAAPLGWLSRLASEAMRSASKLSITRGPNPAGVSSVQTEQASTADSKPARVGNSTGISSVQTKQAATQDSNPARMGAGNNIRFVAVARRDDQKQMVASLLLATDGPSLQKVCCVMSFSLVLTESRHQQVLPSVLPSVRGRGEKGRPIGSSCEVPEVDHNRQRAWRCSLRHGCEVHVSRSATRRCGASGS